MAAVDKNSVFREVMRRAEQAMYEMVYRTPGAGPIPVPPFFFQAEGGIRDYKVPGVQTCALPIYHRRVGHLLRPLDQGERHLLEHAAVGKRDDRSEERRVGEEGRSRWWAAH